MLKPYETYAPRANVPDSNYPLGSIKNMSVPGAKDGTPLDARWGNNIEGFHQALLAEAGIVASGNPDKVGASQLLDALKAVTTTPLSGPNGASLIGWRRDLTGSIARAFDKRLNNADVVDFWEYLTDAEIADTQISNSGVEPTIDLTAKFNQAIADLGGTQDLASAYIYTPAKILWVPRGVYGLQLTGAQRLLIAKNNIRIFGAGTYNTRLLHIGTGTCNEMIRFKGAYACELSDLTLDGGLPFNPTGSETNGANIPLVLDQVAHFKSTGLNITNYRVRGKQCIHVWESYFDDLRITSGGYFGNSGCKPAGISFDSFGKEDNTFPGYESNQVYYGKYAFSAVGSVVNWDAPCFNIHFSMIVSETRTHSFTPYGMDTPKFRVSGISSLIVVDQAWCYFHDQSFISNAALFDFANAGANCSFNNIRVYQEIPTTSPGNNLEVVRIFDNTSAFPIYVDVSIEDKNCSSTIMGSVSTGSTMLTGKLNYRKDTAKTIAELMAGNSNFSGKITMVTGPFANVTPLVYEFNSRSETLSSIDNGGAFNEYACRAISNFNGMPSGGGARMQKGFSSVARSSVGTYVYLFSVPLPDDKYSTCQSLTKQNPSDSIDVINMTPSGFTLLVKDSSGTPHDSSMISVSVFR